jgi:hypothetical protein
MREHLPFAWHWICLWFAQRSMRYKEKSMEQKPNKKLILSKETIRGLTPADMRIVAGGGGIVSNLTIHTVWETLMQSLEHDCLASVGACSNVVELPPYLTTSA